MRMARRHLSRRIEEPSSLVRISPRTGIGILFDVLPRSPENRMTSFLVVTKGKGYDLLNAEPKFERFPAEVIRELAKSRQSMPTP